MRDHGVDVGALDRGADHGRCEDGFARSVAGAVAAQRIETKGRRPTCQPTGLAQLLSDPRVRWKGSTGPADFDNLL